MTIDEILTCKIPEGRYYLHLKDMQQDICAFTHGSHMGMNFQASLCASFGVLLQVANDESITGGEDYSLQQAYYNSKRGEN